MTKSLLFVGTLCLCFALNGCKDAPKTEQNASQEQNHTHHNAQTHSCAHHSQNGTHQHCRDDNATHTCPHHKKQEANKCSHQHKHSFADTPSGKMMKAMHEEMMKHKPSRSASAEIDFLTDMIAHHQGAVDSAKIILTHSNDNAKLKTLAQNIISSQEKEIAEFKALLAKNQFSKDALNENQYRDFFKKNRQAMKKMMKQMHIKESGNIQKDFLKAMIAHHQGAVDVSKIVLEFSKDAQIQSIAKNIINSQEKEITQMKTMLQAL